VGAGTSALVDPAPSHGSADPQPAARHPSTWTSQRERYRPALQRQRTLRATAPPGRCAINAALPTDEQRRQAEWARLNAQIERWRKQARWEPWKALAAILGAAALMIAAALALSHWHVPQTINANVHLVKP
jgi:hypothetical protein